MKLLETIKAAGIIIYTLPSEQENVSSFKSPWQNLEIAGTTETNYVAARFVEL